MTDPHTQNPPDEIVAKPSKDYRVRRFLMAALLLCFGLWCIYDGYVKWPAENARAIADKAKVPHTDLDLQFNRVLGAILPACAVYALLHALRSSRGEYRLAGDVLHVPGHPPVPLSAMREIDAVNLKLWDRKGLVHVPYEDPQTGKVRRFKLDDFIYDRKPTDDIFDRIKAQTNPALASAAEVDVDVDQTIEGEENA